MFSIYFGFLLVCIAGWHKYAWQSKSLASGRKEFVSVVVAVRDEETSISQLLLSIGFQDFNPCNFEVIFVNDHSSDRTEQIITDWIKVNPQKQFYFIHSEGYGKKQSLNEGIVKAKGDIILTTDADCDLPQDWISRMVMSFKDKTTMIIGLVKIHQERSLFSKLQALEFSSVMGTGISLLEFGFPVMCNGASLAFRKKSFEEVNGYQDNVHIPSGDDEFLMRKLMKNIPGSIDSIHWPLAVVTTKPLPNLQSFIQQRLRWAGKWKVNSSVKTKVLALYILIFQVTCMVAIGLLFSGKSLNFVGGLLGMKILFEGYFLFLVSRTLHQPFSVAAFLILQFTYPVYVVIIGTVSQLFDYEWKGRRSPPRG